MLTLTFALFGAAAGGLIGIGAHPTIGYKSLVAHCAIGASIVAVAFI